MISSFKRIPQIKETTAVSEYYPFVPFPSIRNTYIVFSFLDFIGTETYLYCFPYEDVMTISQLIQINMIRFEFLILM